MQVKEIKTMDKKNYFCELWAIRDKVKEEVVHIGRANNGGQYCREVIPNLKNLVPLNDLEAVKIGEINPFTAEIRIVEEPKHYDWKELYNFMITNEAVKNESETSKNTSKE